ncbi:methylmalonyl Co-A mutase-associated GTPase MeaB [Myxococcota bacterium]
MMSSREALDGLVKGVVAGDRRAIARTLRLVDDVPRTGRYLASELHPHRMAAHVVGITGNPGAGKSTVVDGLIAELRERGRKVAVLAVDPSSPFSGGAILGDRIRMSRHATDDGVFIRSLATRGALGGLSRAAFDSTRVLDAAGFDTILLETVGVGQDEVDVARLAQTTVVVLVPGLGDDVQAIKAGILEIADLFLINKADRDGVFELEHSLQQTLTMVPATSSWEVPILKSVASRGEGIVDLLDGIDAHRVFLGGEEGAGRAAHQAGEIFDRMLDAALVEQGRRRLGKEVESARHRVATQEADPYAEVIKLVEPESALEDK